MTVRLRPHHLLCMLTYVGKGYSPAFTANYDVIAGRIARGEPIAIVDGPDDICRPLLDDPGAHCRGSSVRRRDARAAEDVHALLGLECAEGEVLVLGEASLARLRAAFAAGTIRAACAGCEWSALCTSVAEGDFRDTKV